MQVAQHGGPPVWLYEQNWTQSHYNVLLIRSTQIKAIAISSKQDTLSKRDDEMIELVMEEELEQEVEQADVIKEKISLALMTAPFSSMRQ
jgi:hypothetical protein